MTHKLKLNINFCDAVLCGDKNFEIRFNDRGYQKGDYVKFIPYDGCVCCHAISEKVYKITYVTNGFGLEKDWVVFGIKEVNAPEGASNCTKVVGFC